MGRSEVEVAVHDNGRGFDVEARPAGFGLAGMRERVGLAGGTLDIESDGGGTQLRARLPAARAHETAVSLGHEQAAP
jgi:signal transduction histidine kinase